MEIFDSHFHIIDPDFPLVVNNGFKPDYYTVDTYKKEVQELGIELVGGAVVSGSFQGFDQEYFENALPKLGENFVGITQLPVTATDEDILKLNEIGIRGIRFNLYRGLTESLENIEKLSRRVYCLTNWKTEVYLNLDTMNEDLEKLISVLPKVSIDHIGMGANSKDKLKKFLSYGIPVRVTGFGRVEYTKEELVKILPELYSENQKGLMFGTDLPSTRARERFNLSDIQLIKDVFSEKDCNNIFVENGKSWYLEK